MSDGSRRGRHGQWGGSGKACGDRRRSKTSGVSPAVASPAA